MKLLATATAFSACLLTAAPAAAGTATFVRDGVTYLYNVETKGDVRIITGQQKGGDRFRLVVKRGWVSGEVGPMPVSFRVKDAVSETPARAVETAAR